MTIPKLPGQLRENQHFLMEPGGLEQIAEAVPGDFQLIGPVREKWAINLAPFEHTDELAFGCKVNERRASYRIEDDPGNLDLSAARPMNSPKSFNFHPKETIYETRRENGGVAYETPQLAPDKKVFFGIHACDVAGLFVLDRTFSRRYPDPAYAARRQDTIVIGVNCLEPGANCFCSTFDTGPDLKGGFDIGLSWIDDKWLVEVATETGARLMSEVDKEPARPEVMELKNEKIRAARSSMAKAFDLKKGLRALNDNYDHPYWEEPAERCLSCANCINVCPTCFCYRMTDESALDGAVTARTRQWDACQNEQFASVHGGNFRPERVDRIRQWVNHKINWTIEQYGVSGCVGCGRCVTWCPTAIDITEPVWRLGGKDIGFTA